MTKIYERDNGTKEQFNYEFPLPKGVEEVWVGHIAWSAVKTMSTLEDLRRLSIVIQPEVRNETGTQDSNLRRMQQFEAQVLCFLENQTKYGW
jgi:hypothetical protein